MALAPRDFPITREQVHGWLSAYDGRIADTKRLRSYLQGQIDVLGLDDDQVLTGSHDDLKDTTPILEMIMADISSYA